MKIGAHRRREGTDSSSTDFGATEYLSFLKDWLKECKGMVHSESASAVVKFQSRCNSWLDFPLCDSMLDEMCKSGTIRFVLLGQRG